jgi:hypothetical protein
VYYFNTVTSESAWTEPEGFQETGGPSGGGAVSVDATAVTSTRIKGTAWSLVACVDGRKYYVNSVTEVCAAAVPAATAAAPAAPAVPAPAAAAAAVVAVVADVDDAAGAVGAVDADAVDGAVAIDAVDGAVAIDADVAAAAIDADVAAAAAPAFLSGPDDTRDRLCSYIVSRTREQLSRHVPVGWP